eukprot:scaffold116937_cov36-Tisochrysis_lutea.AAC.2
MQLEHHLSVRAQLRLWSVGWLFLNTWDRSEQSTYSGSAQEGAQGAAGASSSARNRQYGEGQSDGSKQQRSRKRGKAAGEQIELRERMGAGQRQVTRVPSQKRGP